MKKYVGFLILLIFVSGCRIFRDEVKCQLNDNDIDQTLKMLALNQEHKIHIDLLDDSKIQNNAIEKSNFLSELNIQLQQRKDFGCSIVDVPLGNENPYTNNAAICVEQWNSYLKNKKLKACRYWEWKRLTR